MTDIQFIPKDTDVVFIRDNLVGKKGQRVPEYIAVAVNKYLLEIAALLRLPEWFIVVNDDPPTDEDAAATVTSRRGQKFAGVWLSDRFLIEMMNH